MGEFNRVQRELGKKEISNGSSHNWLKTFRPEFLLIKRTTVMAVQKVKLKFMLQSAQASPQDVKKLEDELKCIKQQNENHRAEANQSHAYYVEVTSRYSSEWTEITSLEEKRTLTDEEKVKLDDLKNRSRPLCRFPNGQTDSLLGFFGTTGKYVLSTKTKPQCFWYSKPWQWFIYSLFV